MCHAWAHYVHVVCTSGHPLRQCSKQPIIYSTLISTHVNPHQSSHAQGDCCGSHTASWQNIRSEHEKTLLGMIRTCHQTRRAPPERAATSSAFKTDQGAQREKVSRRGAGRPRLCPLRSAGSPRPTVRIEPGAGCTAENAPTAVRDGARDGGDGARSKAPRADGTCGAHAAPRPAQRHEGGLRAVLLSPSHVLAHSGHRLSCQTSEARTPSLSVLAKTAPRSVSGEHSAWGFSASGCRRPRRLQTAARAAEAPRAGLPLGAGAETAGEQARRLRVSASH